MKRAIPRSILARMKADAAARETDTPDAPAIPPATPSGKPAGQSGGGAWKAGAIAQVEGDLANLREASVADILAGRRELALDPASIDDPLGSDRRPDWQDTESFTALRDSIAANGQDVPIQVWPADPAWTPDPRDPHDIGAARFHLLSGRRRRAACAALDLPVRAVLVPPPEDATDAAHRFTMLFHRFRENEAREDLSPFERLVSIGEIYEALAAAEEGAPTAVAFAARIGVHESLVSRARAVLRNRDAIVARNPDPYALTFRALQDMLAEIEGKAKPAAKPKPKKSAPVTATVTKGGRSLTATAKSGTITVRTDGLDLDEKTLHAVLVKIANALPVPKKAPKKETKR